MFRFDGFGVCAGDVEGEQELSQAVWHQRAMAISYPLSMTNAATSSVHRRQVSEVSILPPPPPLVCEGKRARQQ